MGHICSSAPSGKDGSITALRSLHSPAMEEEEEEEVQANSIFSHDLELFVEIPQEEACVEKINRAMVRLA